MPGESDLELAPYDASFLAPSLAWLTDPEIAWLTMTPPFTEASQRTWFAGLPNKTDYLIWGVAHHGRPVGAVGLKNVTDTSAEYWGYVGERNLWGRGLGRQIVDGALRHAVALGLRDVWLRVRTENERAIRLYHTCGFVEEADEGGVIVMRRSL